MKTITLTEEEQRIILEFLPIPNADPKEPMGYPRPNYSKLPENLKVVVEALRLRLTLLILLCAFAANSGCVQGAGTDRDGEKMGGAKILAQQIN